MDQYVVKITATSVVVAILSIMILKILIAPPHLKGSKDVLSSAKVIGLNGGVAPESVDFDPDGGGPYVGVADGRILKWANSSIGWTDFAVTSTTRKFCGKPLNPALEPVCGRPLGLRFEKKSGDLYICDCYFGLMKVGPEGGVATSVLKVAEDRPLHFTNHLDIDEVDDVIYLTDSSIYYTIRQLWTMFFTQDFTGRVIRYEKSTGEAKEILGHLHFPNGVALSKDRSFLLVAESTTSLIYRVWLKGPNAGKHETFTDKLPGSPDNIRRNSNGEFWVALHAKNGLFAKITSSSPFISELVLKLFSYPTLEYLVQGGMPHAVAVKLSENGEIMEILEDSKGKSLRILSEVTEYDGKLWFGSFTEPFTGVYDLKQLPNN